MAPLAAKDEIDPRDFAMLTDRVQLRLSGQQRYGTQWTCKSGKRVPLSLANNAAVTDALRAKAKLGSLKANAAQIDTLYGPCPQRLRPATYDPPGHAQSPCQLPNPVICSHRLS